MHAFPRSFDARLRIDPGEVGGNSLFTKTASR